MTVSTSIKGTDSNLNVWATSHGEVQPQLDEKRDCLQPRTTSCSLFFSASNLHFLGGIAPTHPDHVGNDSDWLLLSTMVPCSPGHRNGFSLSFPQISIERIVLAPGLQQ